MSRGGKREGAGRKPVSLQGNRVQFSVRIDPAYVPIIDHLMERHGLTRSGVVEMGIRQLTEHGIVPWDGPPVPPSPRQNRQAVE